MEGWKSQQEVKCGIVVSSSAGDGLEPDYIQNGTTNEMRINSNERYSHKTETAAGAGVYDNVVHISILLQHKTTIGEKPNNTVNIYIFQLQLLIGLKCV